jgi:hypothetical protein
MIQTADTPEEAEVLEACWAAEIVLAGLAPYYGAKIHEVRLPHGKCWGVFIEPHEEFP